MTISTLYNRNLLRQKSYVPRSRRQTFLWLIIYILVAKFLTELQHILFFLTSKQLYFQKLSVLLSIIKKKQNRKQINSYNFLEKRFDDVLHKLHYLPGYFINEINY